MTTRCDLCGIIIEKGNAIYYRKHIAETFCSITCLTKHVTDNIELRKRYEEV